LSVGHVFRKQAAGTFGPDLAKKLSQLVKMEKNVMRSMEVVGRERMEVAVRLAIILSHHQNPKSMFPTAAY
jgi:Eisosome component PIL1